MEGATPSPGRMPWGTALGLGLASLAVHALVAGSTDLVPDEAYYALWSRHLAWSYPDHPPAVAGFIALFRLLLGERDLAIRMPALLTAFVVPLALAAALARLAGSEAARRLLWLLHATLLLHVLGVVTTPDTPLTLAWGLALSLLLCLFAGVVRPAARLALVAGVGLCAGFAALAKLTGWALLAGVLAAAITSPSLRQRLGGGRGIALLAGVALLVASPWLHALASDPDASSLTFQLARLRARGTPLSNLLGYLGGQAGVVGPGVFILALGHGAGVLRLGARSDALGRLLAWLALPLLVSFLLVATLRPVEANWVGPGWLSLLVGVALRPPPARALRASLVVGLTLVAILHGLVFVAPMTPLSRLGALARLFGWRTLAEDVERRCGETPLRVRDYGVASELAWTLGEARVAPRIVERPSAFSAWSMPTFEPTTGACAVQRCDRWPERIPECRWRPLLRSPGAVLPWLCVWRLECGRTEHSQSRPKLSEGPTEVR